MKIFYPRVAEVAEVAEVSFTIFVILGLEIVWPRQPQQPRKAELVGFQTMVILDPYDMAFDAVGVFGLDFWLLFKSALSYCDMCFINGPQNMIC